MPGAGTGAKLEALEALLFLVSLKARGTVEEKVLALHERKRALSGAVLDGASDSALSEDDLLALLRRD